MATLVPVRVPSPVARSLNWFRNLWRYWAYRNWLAALSRMQDRDDCDIAIELDAAKLIAAGHTRAAVFAVRLAVEMRLSELCDFAPPHLAMKRRRHISLMVPYLFAVEYLSKGQSRQVVTAYQRASKLVHGSQCTKRRAVSVIAALQACVEMLDGRIAELAIERPRVVQGFAAGGAL